MRIMHTVLLSTVLSAAMTTSVLAATAPSAQDIAAIKNFKLNEEFLKNWEGYQQEVATDPCNLSPIFAFKKAQGAGSSSFDDVANDFDRQKGVHAALAHHNLTAHEAILGMTVLLRAGAQNLAQEHPDLVKKGFIKLDPKMAVSDETVSFYAKHKDQLIQHQTALAKKALAANGGKLPACMQPKTNSK